MNDVAMNGTRPAVFIDRDGVLNDMVYDDDHGSMDSPRRPEQVRMAKGATQFVHGLRESGLLAVVVTNQPGIAKGTMTLDDLERVNSRLKDLLEEGEGGWDALYYCPHHPEKTENSCDEFVEKCVCRKPLPGMLLNAAEDLQIRLEDSWMVGDGIVDVQAGRAAGCRTILISNMKLDILEHMFQMKEDMPDLIAADLEEALHAILKGDL